MGIRAVIFDLDGTITVPFLDFDKMRVEMGMGLDGGPILEAMERMSEDERKKAERILDEYEERAIEASELNDGVMVTFERLRKAGIRIGILTRNKKSNAYAVAKKHGLDFEAIFDREDGPVKPDAYGVKHLCEQFGVKPEDTVLVGDGLFDLQSAKAAGAISVLLKHSESQSGYEKYADFVIERIDEILSIAGVSNDN